MQKFKNCFWLLLVILLCQGILQAEDNQNYSYAVFARHIPTDYIIQFLAKSGTKWRGNKEWIKDLTKIPVETNFLIARYKDKLYQNTGAFTEVWNFAGGVSVDSVSAKFEIKRDFENVEIKSKIEKIEISNINSQEMQELKSDTKKVDVHEEDLHSTCNHTITAEPYDNDDNNKLRIKIKKISSCISKMPVYLFEKKIEKNRDSFRF